tara:strand:- start:128 stop:355 length:228 start_codon:yes stop_codon:yes gene_type:complete
MNKPTVSEVKRFVVSEAVKGFLMSLENVGIRSDTHELQILRLILEGLEQRATELYEDGLSKQHPQEFTREENDDE